MFETHTVPTFGGGLNFAAHPAAIKDNEWTWCDGFVPMDNYAEMARRYVQINDGAWLPSGTAFGIAQNPFSATAAALLLSGQSAGQLRLWTMADGAVPTQINWDAVGTAATFRGGGGNVASWGYLNGFLVAAAGAQNPGGPFSLLKWNGGATWSTVTATGGLMAEMVVSAFGRIIVAFTSNTAEGARTIRWCDADDITAWDPSIANSADFVTLNSRTPITGMALFADGSAIAVFTHDEIWALVPTGGIPAFTLRLVRTRGAYAQNPGSSSLVTLCHSHLGQSPHGLIFRSWDGIFSLDQETRLSAPLGRYFLTLYNDAEFPVPHYVWDAARGVIISIRRFIPNGTNDQFEMAYLNPETGAWGRRVLTALSSPSAALSHAYLRFNPSIGSNNINQAHWLLEGNGRVLREDTTSNAPQGGEFVDTKDFGGADGPRYIDEIKLDWEPLNNASTDAIEVLAFVREDLSRGFLGAPGTESDHTADFVSLGTVTGGVSKLKIRRRGKYTRFRFKQSNGRVRIRGFALRTQVGGDRSD